MPCIGCIKSRPFQIQISHNLLALRISLSYFVAVENLLFVRNYDNSVG